MESLIGICLFVHLVFFVAILTIYSRRIYK